MWKYLALIITLLAVLSMSAAGSTKIDDKSEFLKVIKGKTLTRTLIKIRVSSAGSISGRGASWDLNGKWTWKNGYFCRNLIWGGTELGYNCQEVGLSNGKLRFTSDQGRGDSAEFKLR